MVCNCPEWLFQETSKILHPYRAGLFRILKNISAKPYVLDLPLYSAINPIFNVKDPTIYHEHVTYDHGEEQGFTLLAFIPDIAVVVGVLDDQIDSTRQGGYQKFLFHW